MLICPDCSAPHDWHGRDACSSCGWTPERIGDFPVVLSDRDRSGLFDHYRRNYDQIASDDQSTSTQDPENLRTQASLIARLASPLVGRSAPARTVDKSVDKSAGVHAVLGHSDRIEPANAYDRNAGETRAFNSSACRSMQRSTKSRFSRIQAISASNPSSSDVIGSKPSSRRAFSFDPNLLTE